MRLTGGPRCGRRVSGGSRRALRLLIVGSFTSSLLAAVPAGGAVVARRAEQLPAPSCPWAAPNAASTETPQVLAAEVLAHMDLTEKLTIVDLAPGGGYENQIPAIPELCLPAFTLQDGPNGIAFGDRGVTQLPSSLGVAASFDAALAYQYGQVEGAEAHRQGVDVVQGPNLNIDRVPESGRAFEGYGEDPFLVSVMGDADIEGIQSEGVMADAKHFTAYNQETDRVGLDEQVSERALQEIYLAPFRAAVTVAHVASLMCSYGELNGVNDCSDAALYKELYTTWGFSGFVRSDLRAVLDAPPAFAAGLDIVKPGEPGLLKEALADHQLRMSRLNDAIDRLLIAEFTYQLIEHPLTGHLRSDVATRADSHVALAAAEESMVLLKNNGVLPLPAHQLRSIAVIGDAASTDLVSTGGGSAKVAAPFLSKPLGAIAATTGPRTHFDYVPAGSAISALATPPLSGFHVSGPAVLAASGHRLAGETLEAAKTYAATGWFPGRVSSALSSWRASVVAPVSGAYEFSVTGSGNSWLYVNGKLVYSSPGIHEQTSWTVPVTLNAGAASIMLRYYPTVSGGVPQVGWQYTSPDIAAAVRAAERSQVAIVFANDASSEGSDRPTLRLPGDQNELISAVAAVNPRTVVVLDTGGPVLMPWLAKVGAVLEAWYPGEQDGAATAALLFGKVDPSGHLPVTFPANENDVPTHSPETWPGVAGVVDYSEGLNVGYRYQQAHHLTPLFPFGYGLSYTRFTESALQVLPDASGGYEALVTVHNIGRRAGTAVIQGYLAFPAAAGEPPLQLKAFTRVALAPHASATVTLELPYSAFTAYLGGNWQTVPGDYTLRVGESSAKLPLAATMSAPSAPPASSATGGSGTTGPGTGVSGAGVAGSGGAGTTGAGTTNASAAVTPTTVAP